MARPRYPDGRYRKEDAGEIMAASINSHMSGNSGGSVPSYEPVKKPKRIFDENGRCLGEVDDIRESLDAGVIAYTKVNTSAKQTLFGKPLPRTRATAWLDAEMRRVTA